MPLLLEPLQVIISFINRLWSACWAKDWEYDEGYTNDNL